MTLKSIHNDNNTQIEWVSSNGIELANLNDEYSISFMEDENNSWIVHLSENYPIDDMVATTLKVFEAFISKQNPDAIAIYRDNDQSSFIGIATTLSSLFEYQVGICSDEIVMFNENMEFDGSNFQILEEEPNTSLMYHKLFPDNRLLNKLEGLGFTFRMGQGLKIFKKHFSGTHRSSGPNGRRTLQSIVIMKDGKFFRKIPKAKWVMLQDPSDQKSETFGTLYMRKLLRKTEDLLRRRKEHAENKKKERKKEVE